MEPMLNMMMEAEPTGMVIDTKWAAENFSPADLSNLENVLNANYAFPLAPMNFGGSPDNSLPDTIYQTQGSFPESTSPGSGYGSLEYDGPDSGCSLALEGHSTSKSDAKEKSKEVSTISLRPTNTVSLLCISKLFATLSGTLRLSQVCKLHTWRDKAEWHVIITSWLICFKFTYIDAWHYFYPGR